MKRSNLILAAGLFITTAVLTSCNSSAQKVENAKENVVEATEDLNNANEEYLADMDNYRKTTIEKMEANDKSITEFKVRIENEKKEAKAEYSAKINELEKKNTDFKKKLADYKADGKSNWEAFKIEFSREMDELASAISSLGTNNKK